MPSQTILRQALAESLDDWEQHTLSSGSVSTAVSATLVNATAGVSSGLYEGAWVFHQSGTNAPQIRKISAYVPSTGTITVTPAWLAPAVNGVIEITRLAPAISGLGSDADYRTWLNKALAKLLIHKEVTQAITANATTYSLASFKDILNRRERLLRILEPNPITGWEPFDTGYRPEIYRDPQTGAERWGKYNARGFRLDLDGDTPHLRLDVPYALTTGGLTLQHLRTSLSWTKVAATWATSTVGLSAESDETMSETEDVKVVALAEVYETLLNRSPGFPSDPQLAAKLETQRALARSVNGYDVTQDRQSQPSEKVA